jgi:hypothetical protein
MGIKWRSYIPNITHHHILSIVLEPNVADHTGRMVDGFKKMVLNLFPVVEVTPASSALPFRVVRSSMLRGVKFLEVTIHINSNLPHRTPSRP